MTVNEIFRIYGNEYLEKFEHNMLPSHLRALKDISRCRTDIMGTVHWYCPKCGEEHFSYMPCRNRSCPGCQNDKKIKWTIKQLDLKLPVEYFMATFTIPHFLGGLARSNQKLFYNILFNAAAQSILKLAKDEKYMGGQIGIVGILHTWARNLAFHPHVHFLIPGVAISYDKKKILFSKKHFLVYAASLSQIFRAIFIKLLKKSDIENSDYNPAFVNDWVVDLRSVGSGQKAIEYVAKYIYKTAIANTNIISCKESIVTFQYEEYETKKTITRSVPVMEFIRMFLQHVLPRSFQKVRYYGILHPKNRLIFNIIRLLLRVKFEVPDKYFNYQSGLTGIKCPNCGTAMVFIETLDRAPP